MHLRRALLLFAIVLGLAAIVTTVSEPPRRHATSDSSARDSVPSPTPAPVAGGPRRIRLSAGRRPAHVLLADGRAATVTVSVPAPGQVDIRGLGLTDAAEQHSPASFDVLAPGAGAYEVDYTPAGGTATDRVGTIVVPAPRG